MAEVIRMPLMSDTMEEGTIVEWHKEVGDAVEAGDILADVETDKATMELENYEDGVLLYIGPKAGDTVPVDGILAIIGEEGEEYESLLDKAKEAGSDSGSDDEDETETTVPASSDDDGSAPQPEASEQLSQDGDGRIKASPLARSMAEEQGINLSDIKGTGDGGRIVKRDIENYKPADKPAAPQAQPQRSAPTPPPADQPEETYEDVNTTQMRKAIARRLADSKFQAPHFYLTIDIDMAKAVETRSYINSQIEGKVSYNDLIVKSAAMALRKHPQVNASWYGDVIRYHKQIHVGVAVAIDEGLIVPVVRHTDRKSLTTINEEVKDYATRARNKELQPEEYSGNTFSISNLGMFGIEEFTAIINPPDACILAVGRMRDEAVVEDGQVVPGKRMKVTLSCDHRVVDGATGAKFLQTFQELMEDPIKLLV